jgi:FMN reductase
MKLVGIGGGLVIPSRSWTALKIAAEGAIAADVDITLLNLNELDLPFYRPEQPLEQYSDPQKISDFVEKVNSANALLLSAPTYHGTIGGAYKNALDFLEFLPRKPRRYLEGKLVGLIAVGGGQSAASNTLTALMHLTCAMRGVIAPSSVSLLQARRHFDKAGNLLDEAYISQLHELGAEVVRLARALT